VTARSSSFSPGAPVARPESLDPKLRELYRTASAADKLAIVGRLNATLLALKRAQLDARQPALASGEITAELRRWWFSSRD
jgi:hypothetical protein